MYEYRATIVRVIDGDTLEVAVDLGFRIVMEQTLRLLGVNAPEMNAPGLEERAKAQAAKEFVAGICWPGRVVRIQSHKPRPTDRYGRWLATITLPDGCDLTEQIIAAGHGIRA